MIRTIIMIVRAGQSITEHDKSGREIAVKIDTVGHINFTNGTERWRGLFVIRLPGLIQPLRRIYLDGIESSRVSDGPASVYPQEINPTSAYCV